jgi:hypothetical protein
MSSSTNTNNVNKTGAPLTNTNNVKFFVFVKRALVLFTLFVFLRELMSCLRYLCLLEYLLSYFTLFVFVGGAPVLISLFVFVEELMKRKT